MSMAPNTTSHRFIVVLVFIIIKFAIFNKELGRILPFRSQAELSKRLKQLKMIEIRFESKIVIIFCA
jgi:hypothetical protein